MLISLQLTRRAGIFAFALCALALAMPVDVKAEGAPDPQAWVIEADSARGLLADGALLFDTRNEDLRSALPVEGAVAVAWQDFTEPELPDKGKLLADDGVLAQKMRALGVSAGKPVVVIADSKAGWGEDGRIVWTLRSLGHAPSYLVNGGVQALLADGPVTLAKVTTGDFTVARTDDYAITKEDLKAGLGSTDLVILDTREPREYAGETPYGETRGGHVPGAKSLFYKDLVGEDGKILQGDALKARLTDLGVGPDTQVVSYCTGGIRSGFVTAVLRNAGVDARNYAGSMWEWSAGPAEEYPLVTE
jgi:thiosulfate/3-mercaptopyruvate sulfurtransferase